MKRPYRLWLKSRTTQKPAIPWGRNPRGPLIQPENPNLDPNLRTRAEIERDVLLVTARMHYSRTPKQRAAYNTALERLQAELRACKLKRQSKRARTARTTRPRTQ